MLYTRKIGKFSQLFAARCPTIVRGPLRQEMIESLFGWYAMINGSREKNGLRGKRRSPFHESVFFSEQEKDD